MTASTHLLADTRLVVDGDTLRMDGAPMVRTHLALQAQHPEEAALVLRRLAACWAICEGLQTESLEAASTKTVNAHKLVCQQVLAAERINTGLLGMVNQLAGALGVCVSRLAEHSADDKGLESDLDSLRQARDVLARMGGAKL